MRKKALVAVGICVSLVAAYLWTKDKPHDGEGAGEVATIAVAKPPVVAPPPSGNQVVKHASVGAHTASERDPYICWINKDQCLYEPLAAATEAEAEWLLNSGYPSIEEARALSALSVDQLTAKAALGDTKAEVFLGKALVANGKAADGLSRMADASAKGNVYASYAMAEVHDRGGAMPNPVMSKAYYRLAYLQGDWKATAVASEQSADLGMAEAAMADRQAMYLYRNLLDEKGRSGYRLNISPRPD